MGSLRVASTDKNLEWHAVMSHLSGREKNIISMDGDARIYSGPGTNLTTSDHSRKHASVSKYVV